ncbi:unnamed protein product, partial [Mesorhabditis belari]|uniref:Uncharacterized protein n=1 Tax=Mesorhabditis belari TaxID=2138241 RepID=A0AAF3FRM6_9BILA
MIQFVLLSAVIAVISAKGITVLSTRSIPTIATTTTTTTFSSTTFNNESVTSELTTTEKAPNLVAFPIFDPSLTENEALTTKKPTTPRRHKNYRKNSAPFGQFLQNDERQELGRLIKEARVAGLPRKDVQQQIYSYMQKHLSPSLMLGLNQLIEEGRKTNRGLLPPLTS